jgi:phage/plasmid-associated DNA primase
MRIVKFERVFSGSADEVKDYKEQLEAEYSGIFNWAIAGLKAWQDTGSLAETVSVTENVATYIQDANSVARWMADHTAKDKHAVVSCRSAYDAFKQWADETDEVCRTDSWFGRRMGEIGYHSTSRRTDGGVKKVYTGFSINGVKQEQQPKLIDEPIY